MFAMTITVVVTVVVLVCVAFSHQLGGSQHRTAAVPASMAAAHGTMPDDHVPGPVHAEHCSLVDVAGCVRAGDGLGLVVAALLALLAIGLAQSGAARTAPAPVARARRLDLPPPRSTGDLCSLLCVLRT